MPGVRVPQARQHPNVYNRLADVGWRGPRVVDRPLLDTRLSPQGSHAGSEAGMARSCLASAPFCSACSQAAELTCSRHRDFQSHELACCGADLRTRGGKRGPSVGSPLEPASHSRVSRNGMPRLRATYKGRDAESSPQVHTTKRGLWLVSALARPEPSSACRGRTSDGPRGGPVQNARSRR